MDTCEIFVRFWFIIFYDERWNIIQACFRNLSRNSITMKEKILSEKFIEYTRYINRHGISEIRYIYDMLKVNLNFVSLIT